MANDAADDQRHDALLMLYPAFQTDVRTFQDRQNSITYQAAVAFAALVAYSQYGPQPQWLHCVLLSLVLLVTIMAVRWIGLLQTAMHQARRRLYRTGQQLETVQDVLQLGAEKGWIEPSDPIFFLWAIVAAGAVLAVVAIWIFPPSGC
jgi:hypothetical protein